MSWRTRAWIVILPVTLALSWIAWQALARQMRAEVGAEMSEQGSCRKLTPEEQRVIVGKATEIPFSGKYWNLHADGTYRCKRCGAALYPSTAKFDSGTGWPSFDDALPGAVREIPDPDGMRTEIVCAACGAHLGHVFRGEGFTPNDVRYCVNSVSLDFEPTAAAPGRRAGPQPASSTAGPGAVPATQEAYFAGGCFWGVEYWFQKAPGVILAESGYMGGRAKSPTYEQVCSGTTGHAETVRVVYDPSKTSYEALARLFFEIHDPTQVNRQGPDVGEQYRSVVFYASEEQKRVAEKLISDLERRGYDVATRVLPANGFWRAEDYHQHYYEHKGTTPYCHARVRRFGD